MTPSGPVVGGRDARSGAGAGAAPVGGSDAPAADPSSVRAVGRWSLAWRVLAAVALVLLLLNGSLRMEDDAWPFGPMSQYAFSPPEDDTVVVTRVYGLLADGERVELPLRVETGPFLIEDETHPEGGRIVSSNQVALATFTVRSRARPRDAPRNLARRAGGRLTRSGAAEERASR